MMSILLIAHPHPPDPASLTPLQTAGMAPQSVLPGDMLVRTLEGAAPNLVVVLGTELQDGGPPASLRELLQAALPSERAALPCPLLLWLRHGRPEDTTAATALGVHDVVLGEATPERLVAAAALAQARWTREAAWAAERTALQARLNERKWVERAKGVLMSARSLAEDEAFALLRGAAMAAKLHLSEVSRSVIDAAQWADAVNRSGQLRMLSQRLMKLAVQRLAGVDAQRTLDLQAQAAQQLQANLLHLQALLHNNATAHSPLAEVLKAPLAQLHTHWQALQDTLTSLTAQRKAAAALLMLQASDARAEALLSTAEALTQALENAGGRNGLHLVNLCGRQRMRVQRLAKEALFTRLLRRDNAALLQALQQDVEQSLLELEAAPLNSPETRAVLASARDEWLRLLRALHAADAPAHRATLSASSDALLETFDRLTEAYEHNLHLILG